MPIIGNLCEFPLPEVLLLIGTRTGRLRLLDVPEFGMMEIDFSLGQAQAMQIGGAVLTGEHELIAKMSAVVQTQGGMFEFRIQPVACVARDHPIMVNQLVMSLVCYVDEQLALQRPPAMSDHRYLLEEPRPEIWVEPELDLFLDAALPFLRYPGVHLDALSRALAMELAVVYQNLTNLRLLGVVKLSEDEVQATPENILGTAEKISRKSNEFLRASRAASELVKVTGRMPAISKPAARPD